MTQSNTPSNNQEKETPCPYMHDGFCNIKGCQYNHSVKTLPQDTPNEWEKIFDEHFDFGGYSINGDKYVSLRYDGDKNDNKIPDKLKAFISSFIESARSDERKKILQLLKHAQKSGFEMETVIDLVKENTHNDELLEGDYGVSE